MNDYSCEFALEVFNLNKRYRSSDFELKNVSFNIPKGTIMGLIGENGSGKTTTLSSMLGISKYDSGMVRILGVDVENNAAEINDSIGVVLGEDCFPGELTPQNIEAVMRRIYREWNSAKYENCLEVFDIQHNKKIRDFSSGMKRKLSLAIALAHNPHLLILDEVTSGLDPVSRETVLDKLMEYMQNSENSILITSHITSDLEKIADYIAVIDGGRILLVEEKDKLLYEYAVARIEPQYIKDIDENRIYAWVKSGAHINALIRNKNDFEKANPGIMINKPSIEEIAVIIIKRREK